ncbi:MAG: response regulator [Bacteroidales bacterium]|nr:response regulator [Bacteroidales bacterium]
MKGHSHFPVIFTFMFVFFQTCFCELFAQSPNLVFRHLHTEDGLSQSTVHAIVQDSYGFMWFGTDNGLNKYDGKKFVVYHHDADEAKSLSSNFIVEIFEDSHGCLWVGNGYNGLDLFNRETEEFIHFRNDPSKEGSISNNNIRVIYEDKNKNLWIGTSGGGLNRYNRNTNSFEHILHEKDKSNSIGSNYISSICEDSKANLWFGSTEGILIKFNPIDSTYTNIPLYGNYKADLFNTTFCNLYIDSDDNVWFGTEIGIFIYNQATGEIEHLKYNNTNKGPNVNAISSVLEFEKGIFFIATDHGGLNIYNKKTGIFTYHLNKRYDETTISNNQLYDIYRSHNGVIWIGSFHGGINIYDKNAIKFQQYKYLLTGDDALNCCNSVLSIAEDKDKNIWIGYDGQGMDIYNPATGKVRHLYNEPDNPNTIAANCITEIYRDKFNNMWIGTYLEGLSVFNPENGRYRHFKHDAENPWGIGGNNIWTITESSDGNIWIGTIGNGADRYNPSTNIFEHFTNSTSDKTSLSNNDVFKIFEDKEGNIWIGTRNGLNLLKTNEKSFIRFISGDPNGSNIFGAWVYDIFQDSNGNIWVGTDLALNLYLPEKNSFVHFSEADGLNGNSVLCIMEDNNNYLWLSTNKGLTRFSFSDSTFKNYDIVDGLQGNEFNYTSSLRASDGKLYFGGKNGFNVFHPDSVNHNQHVPPVYFTGLSILNTPVSPGAGNIIDKHINFAKEVGLNYRQNVVTFEFAALNFTNPQKNQYAYKLEGFDKKWNYVGNRNEVTYTNLNPGIYTFRVIASNNDGVWNREGASIKITIHPPYWKARWFTALVLAVIALMVYLFIRGREKRLLRDKKILQEKVAERTVQIESQKEELENHRNHLEQLIELRTEELRKAKEKAEESDRLKSAFLANMSHEIRTPMNAIVGFSNLLNEADITEKEKREFIDMINSHSDSLLVLIEDILDLSLIEANQITIRKKAFELNDFINKIYASFLVSNKNSNIKLALKNSLEEKNLRLNTDQYRVKQILTNLLNNALKYTTEGYVELGCISEDENLIFYVKDTGVGISEEDAAIIFDRFRKLEKNYATAYRGAGLGLAISKRLSELLGGSITVSSEQGHGSVFYLTFPVEGICTSEEIKKDMAIDKIGLDWEKKRILIVEDEEANFLYLQKLLRKTQAKVEWAKNGHEAVSIFKDKNGFDLILMDIKMPVMNGYEAARIIKNNKPAQVIIAQTAYARPEDEYEIRRAGFNDYLSKPISSGMLFSVLEKYF